MNLLADESVDRPIVEQLRRDGHHVVFIAEVASGVDDDTVLKMANEESALLLTSDKDFGELVYRLRLHTLGVVLLRLAGIPPEQKAEIVSLAVKKHYAEMKNSFTVITAGMVCIRQTR